MIEKIIIKNETDLAMRNALFHVLAVMDEGRISDGGKSFCHVTSFKDGVHVVVRRNKASDTFIVWKEEKTESSQDAHAEVEEKDCGGSSWGRG